MSISLLVGACKEEKKGIAEGIIPVKKMSEIMSEVLYADAYAVNQGLATHPEAVEVIKRDCYHQIFQKYGVKDADFYASYQYYEEHPEYLKAVFDSTTQILTQQQGSIFTEDTSAPTITPEMVKRQFIPDSANPILKQKAKEMMERREEILRNKSKGSKK
ncbi:MAG: DUF4296 domain-containing protein [Chitinophagales bacterium]|nr:DUF4296 domain-containing protein [Chitinophagales bacterium]